MAHSSSEPDSNADEQVVVEPAGQESPSSIGVEEATSAFTSSQLRLPSGGSIDAGESEDESEPVSTDALEWRAPVLVRIDEHTTIPYLLQRRVQRSQADY